MAKIAFILLCHKDPKAIVAQATQITAAGDYVSIHYDGRAKASDFKQICADLGDNPNVAIVKNRVKCGWGEWSLIKATLRALETAVDLFPKATHFYMLSGDCQATKTAEFAHDFLDQRDVDFIESFDYFKSDWIKTGMKEERLIYRHFFNERKHKGIFYASYKTQKHLGLTRQIPEDLRIMIGSQWWCLRRRTVEWVLDFTRERKDVMRFFSTTWIPDETFFQTIVRHVVPGHEIETRTLTFLMFTDYGMPVTFHNDHHDLLLSQNFLFARKISPEATELKDRLGALYAQTGVSFNISNEGKRLFKFMAGRGREGRRFATRFWEAESTLGRDRELLIVVCKKWHVAKRMLASVREHTKIPVIEYLFNEHDAGLPDLGGLEKTLQKRTRHRRSFVRLLFDHYNSNRMIICLDPASHDLISDFYGDRAKTRLLEIECEFSDDFLLGHAKRVGLAGENTPEENVRKLIPSVRQDVAYEHGRLKDAGLQNHFRITQWTSAEENAANLAEFLGIDRENAQKIANTNHLFAD